MKKSTGLMIGISAICITKCLGMDDATKIKSKQSPLNVVTIIIDDAGWRDVGYQGSLIKTPNIDKLAAKSVRFTQFYSAATCTPARASFLTGIPSSSFGITNPIGKDQNIGIPEKMTTLPEIFQKNNYKTALIGKWHIGEHEKYLPNNQGFDYCYGMQGGWTDHYTRQNPGGGYDWYRNGKVEPFTEGHTTDLITDDAVKYIQKQGKQEKFFLYLSYTAPHVPIQVDPKYADMYKDIYSDKVRQGYAGMMTHVDEGIGRILDTLKKNNLMNNTVILFFSDNGPSSPGKKWYIKDGFHKKNYFGNNGIYGAKNPLNGWKASVGEGAIRVPAFVYYPNEKNGDIFSPVKVEDMYKTLPSLAGVKNDTKNQSNGRDLKDNIEKAKELTAVENEKFTLYRRTNKKISYRHGDWKLVIDGASPLEKDAPKMLYNIKYDYIESENLAPYKKSLVTKLLKEMQQIYSLEPAGQLSDELKKYYSKKKNKIVIQ